MQPTHELDINLLQSNRMIRLPNHQCEYNWSYIRMTGGLNEVQARVNTIVHNFLAIDTAFLFEVSIESRFDVLDDGFPAWKTVICH